MVPVCGEAEELTILYMMQKYLDPSCVRSGMNQSGLVEQEDTKVHHILHKVVGASIPEINKTYEKMTSIWDSKISRYNFLHSLRQMNHSFFIPLSHEGI